MPVHYVFDADSGLLLVRYSGPVRPKEVIEAIPGMGALIGQNQRFAILLIFDDEVDLSLFDFAGLESIKETAQEVIRRLNLIRRSSAAVVGHQIEPRLLLPL